MSKPTRKIQIGQETTAGTAVAATTIWRGTGSLEDTRQIVFPDEYSGYFPGVTRSYCPKYGAAIKLAGEATYEQLPYIFTSGVKAVTTGVADGGGTGKVYTYPFSTTSPNTFTTFTIEGGDGYEAEEAEYCFVQSFTLSGKAGESLMIDADLIGRQILSTTYTAGLTLPTVEEILFNSGAIYIDLVGGTIGGTLKSYTMYEFSMNVKRTGAIPTWTASGSAGAMVFGSSKLAGPIDATLDVIFEHDATPIAEKAWYRGRYPRKIRLKFLGSALATAATYTNKTLQIDLSGIWEKFDKLDEIDGNDVVKGTMRIRYDTTAALGCQTIIVNNLATLT